ncbi:MAG: LacI family transcriptional regulator [Acidimicrobiia bacterium]|nr:LacI family transcriptional regulator [Acidimicrobiia bacterium]
MPTIAEVAAMAGVSPATVSRVINGRTSVATPTRERVLAAIEELDYTPNRMARALSLGKSAAIYVVAPVSDNPSVAQRLHGLATTLNQSAFELILHDVETAAQTARLLSELATPDRIAAVILISVRPHSDQLAKLAAAEVPVVFVNANVPGVDCVFVDNLEGGRLAARHLLSIGHRKLAFVGDTEDSDLGFTGSRDRRIAFEETLNAAGVRLPDEFIQLGAHQADDARQATLELLDLNDPPTAIFAASDGQAIGVLEAAYSRELDVPGDLSVIGFDDISSAKGMGLTTIRQPLEESGTFGARLALEAVEHKTLGMAMELPVELIIRRSTAPPNPERE